MSVLLSLQQLLNAALLFFIPGPMVSLVRICISGKFRVLRLSRPERDGQNQQRINTQGKKYVSTQKIRRAGCVYEAGIPGGDGPGKGYSDNGSRIKLSP